MLGLLVILVLGVSGQTLAICPHEEDELSPWSEATSWPGGVKPMEGDGVNISSPILLDESPPDLFYINILSAGRLVWSPDVEISVRVKYILVSGTLEIGSEECPYEQQTSITLMGKRGEYELAAGEKVLLVQDGGTLELHGQKKMAWTKLSKTLPKISNSGQVLYEHKNDERAQVDDDRARLVAYTFSVTGDKEFSVKAFSTYDFYNRTKKQHWESEERFAKQIEDMEDGDVFVMAVQYFLWINDANFIPEEAFEAFENATGLGVGKSVFRTVRRPLTYAAVFQKGNPRSLSEVTGIEKDSVASLVVPEFNLAFQAINYGSRSLIKQTDNFKVMTRDGANPVIDVIDDVTSWRPGDKIVVTSTDFDWQQAEEKTIIECLDCSNTQIRINSPIEFMHWGEMIEGAVDSRGEVALLSRNIVIRGEMSDTVQNPNPDKLGLKYDTFGAHVKVMKGFKDVHVEGVELYNAGQHTDLGRYPLHFHMCLETNYTSSPPYLRENSIHNTFARCVTIHGTHGILVKDNVCYKSLGHSYFLEDGGEMDNIFDGNIAIGTLPGNLIPTDKRNPTSYWITNPKTVIRNNVAAGGEGIGFWFVYPIQPTGDSKDLIKMESWEASRTALLEVDNNVVHSYKRWGFNIEEHLDVNQNIQQTNHYQPREDPLNISSRALDIPISRITAFKNRERNIWIEGGAVRLTKSSMADSAKSLAIFNTNLRNQYGEITESVIIGESDNVGEPAVIDGVPYTRSLPIDKHPGTPILGTNFYKGPQYLKDVYFNGFASSPFNSAGALSFMPTGIYGSRSRTGVENVLFGFTDGVGSGNRAFQGNPEEDPYWDDKDGGKTSSFRDIDGSVTSHAGHTVVIPSAVAGVEECRLRSNWKMAICPNKIGKLFVQAKSQEEGPMILVRDEYPGLPMEFHIEQGTGFPVILDAGKGYTLHFPSGIPQIVTLNLGGIEHSQWIRLGVCLPPVTEFNILTWGPHKLWRYSMWTQVHSFEQLEDDIDEGKEIYHNRETGMAYFKIVNPNVRDESDLESDLQQCPGTGCPTLRFIFDESDDLSDADCRGRIYTQSDMNKRPLPMEELAGPIPPTADSPPEGWGAGPSRPFRSSGAVDGGYGDWSKLSECHRTVNGMAQTRYRMCNQPLPAYGGNICDGASFEIRGC